MKINMKTLERGQAGERQVFPVKNERYEAYKTSTGKFKRSG